MDKLPNFEDLASTERDELIRRATTRRYPKNSVLISEGDEGDHVYFILSGNVKVYLSDHQGREVVISQMGPGDYFGEMSLEPGHRSASVMTTEVSNLAVIRMDEFRRFITEHPNFMLALLCKMIRRSRALTKSVKSLALLDVYGRLAQLLTEMSVPGDGTSAVVEASLTQQEIASRIGCSREMVSRIFKDLVAGGYLDVSRQRIEIKRRLPTAW